MRRRVAARFNVHPGERPPHYDNCQEIEFNSGNIGGSATANHAVLRIASYAIDKALLTFAVILGVAREDLRGFR